MKKVCLSSFVAMIHQKQYWFKTNTASICMINIKRFKEGSIAIYL